MADIDLKTLTPDTTLPTAGFVFGADSQVSASPSVYSTSAVATAIGLQFPAGAEATPSISTTSDNDTGVWFPAANTVAVSTAGTERMRITSAGDIGVGTSSPTTALYLKRASGAQLDVLTVENDVDPGLLLIDTGNWSSRIFVQGSTGSLIFENSANNERLRIDLSGNVGIGTSSFGTSAAGVIGIGNGTAPSTSPAGMGQLYVENGALMYRGSSGTVTTIANA
jgi:hypothetical protein